MRRSVSRCCSSADHRAGDVEVGQRQQFERAAQDAEVAMLVAQRIDQRRHETCVGNARQSVHAGLADAPVVGGEQRAHDRVRIGLLERWPAPRRRAGGHRDRRSSATRRYRARHPIRAVTSSMVAIVPTMRSSSRSGPIVTRCCISVNRARRRPRRAGDQVVMKGRGQHLDGAGREHLMEVAQQAARRRDRAPRSSSGRPRASSAARPVAAASQSSQTRTTSDTSVVNTPMSGEGAAIRRQRAPLPLVRRSAEAARPSTIDVKALAWSRSLVVVPRVSLTPAALRSAMRRTSATCASSASATPECSRLARVICLIWRDVLPAAAAVSPIARDCSVERLGGLFRFLAHARDRRGDLRHRRRLLGQCLGRLHRLLRQRLPRLGDLLGRRRLLGDGPARRCRAAAHRIDGLGRPRPRSSPVRPSLSGPTPTACWRSAPP